MKCIVCVRQKTVQKTVHRESEQGLLSMSIDVVRHRLICVYGVGCQLGVGGSMGYG